MENFDEEYQFVIWREDGNFYESYVVNRSIDTRRSNVEHGTSKYGPVIRFVNSHHWHEEEDHAKSK
jgi:hypothetical protein